MAGQFPPVVVPDREFMTLIRSKLLSFLPRFGHLDTHPPKGCVRIEASSEAFCAFEFEPSGDCGQFFGCRYDKDGTLSLDPDRWTTFFIVALPEFDGMPGVVCRDDVERIARLGRDEPHLRSPIEGLCLCGL